MLDHEVPPAEDTLCPRCGATASWQYTDAHESRVELHCPNCGVYLLLRTDFETAMAGRLNEEDREA